MRTSSRLAQFPFHTILLSVYPILYLYSQNYVFTPLAETGRALLASAGLALGLLLGFRLILKSWEKAGLLVTLLVTLFFSFGHVANALPGMSLRFLAAAWLVIFLAASFFVIRIQRPAQATQFLNLAAAVLMVFPISTVAAPALASRASGGMDVERLAQLRGEAAAEAAMPAAPLQQPQIYYIILDGYTRADMLERYYGYDNSTLIEALEARGFYVAEASRSNYLNTTYSLNTSMNLAYIHEFPAHLFKTSRYSLQTNYVSDFLRRQGYRVVVFDSGTGDTNNQYADEFVAAPGTASEAEALVNPFEQLLLRTTLGLGLFQSGTPAGGATNQMVAAVNAELDLRRERITYALTHLPDYAGRETPHFVFAHIYSPHIPFLYGPAATPLTYQPEMNFYWYQPPPEDYVAYYTYQIDYLNRVVLEAIDGILAQARGPLVIVVQGDHGDDKYLDWDAPDARGIEVRSAILNAVYYSDGDYASLYPTLTPVNTYRLVFNHWFQTQFPRLADRVYVHPHPLETPPNVIPEFQDGCAAFQICLP